MGVVAIGGIRRRGMQPGLREADSHRKEEYHHISSE